jgi:uncharacterized protein YukE
MRPISFPFGEASTAQATCDRVASLLGEHLGARADLVATARDGWEGSYRDEFDDTWSTQSTRLSGLQEDLRLLSGKIATAVENVNAANERRATMRIHYIQDLQDQQAQEAI